MPSVRFPSGGTRINTILEMTIQPETKEVLRAPVIDYTVRVAHMKKINVLFSS